MQKMRKKNSRSTGERKIEVSAFRDSDPEEFATCLKYLEIKAMQLEPGIFKGESTFIDLQNVVLGKRTTNLNYLTYGEFPGYVVVVFPLAVEELYFSRKVAVKDHNQIAFSRAGGSVTPKNFELVYVALKIDALDSCLNSNEVKDLLQMVNSDIRLTVTLKNKNTATQFISQIFANLLKENEEADGKKVFDQHNDKLIILYLYEYIKSSYKESVKKERGKTSNASSHERILDRALRFIFEESGNPCSLEKLAEGVFASKRSVQYAFSTLIGMSPTHFSKLVRLNFIRSELVAGGKKGLSVARIFRKYHVSNPARFRREYFDFFKEYPEFRLET